MDIMEMFSGLMGGTGQSSGGTDPIRGMFTGTPDGAGPMQPAQQGAYDQMMGGGGNSAPTNTGGKTSKYAAPTEAMDRELGMSALKHYKDMSNYANMGSLMSPLQGMQSMGQSTMKFQPNAPAQGYQDPYIMSLMNRGG